MTTKLHNHSSSPEPVWRIAVPTPLLRLFDYLPPDSATHGAVAAGARVRVPFGRRTVTGVIMEVGSDSDFPRDRLKRATELLDPAPVLPEGIVALLRWAADYYQHPIGEVMGTALPVLLRQGETPEVPGVESWQLTAEGEVTAPETLARAPRQQALFALLKRHTGGLTGDELNRELDQWRPAARALVEKGLVQRQVRDCLLPATDEPRPAPNLNEHQARAVEGILAAFGEFGVLLVEGVTGSGKTEVYLAAIERALEEGRQVLVLVPEIGLTPQLLTRFRERFAVPIAVMHSGLNDRERLCAWNMARTGKAPIVIGTRSAVFTPLPQLGLIIVDEEHDASFKQQDGFRYHARDLAVMRARNANIPVVLGSATPSLESLANCERGLYGRLHLPSRAGAARPPRVLLLDVRSQPLDEGLSPPLIESVGETLAAGDQVLLFLNRRGYAPTLLCHECGWVANCQRCDAHMTYHARGQRLRCHHCGAERAVNRQCPDCGSTDLRTLGQGTERLEAALRRHFPDTGIVRIDRDTTRRKDAMKEKLAGVHRGEHQLLIGTQMLAKGHDFPGVTLVGLIDIDQGLFSADFRGAERMAQLIVQVAGRAGRGEKPGEVIIQTHHPDHPLLLTLLEGGYRAFAAQALAERRAAGLPPHGYLALFRAEAPNLAAPAAFLEQVRARLGQHAGLGVLGPIPAPMEKRAGRFRAQLLLMAQERRLLHGVLRATMPGLDELPEARRVRWSLDVDPQEMF